MAFLDGKSWIARELYIEYLQLKTDIPALINGRDHFAQRNKSEEVEDFQKDINTKVDRLEFVLNQLKVEHGIRMEDLILLSIGIDV